jgi:hypothetical protein
MHTTRAREASSTTLSGAPAIRGRHGVKRQAQLALIIALSLAASVVTAWLTWGLLWVGLVC